MTPSTKDLLLLIFLVALHATRFVVDRSADTRSWGGTAIMAVVALHRRERLRPRGIVLPVSRLSRPIRTDTELRAAVTLHETTEGIHLEFKCAIQKAGDKGKEDVALDVAAFANAGGGTILVGIKEEEINGVRVAGEVVGCDFESDRKWIEQVIRDRLVPPDVGLECVQLNWDGKVVMAVNVSPDDRLIAVWDRVRATYYPIRNNQGNAYMSPSETAVRSSLSARAGEIKLRRAVDQAGWPGKDANGNDKELRVHLSSGMAEVYHVVESGKSATVEHLARVLRAIKLFELAPDHAYFGIELSGAGSPRYEELYVPYGLVREAWRMGDSRIGLILSMRVISIGNHIWALEQYGD